MKQNYSISVIIPNFNGEVILKENLPRVYDAVKAYDDVELLIIDDASTDNSIAVIEDFIKAQKRTISVCLIKNDTNQGFSSTVNRAAVAATGDILLLLNTDVAPEKDFLTPLISRFADASLFAVGCMDKSREEDKIVLRGRGVGKWQRGLLIHARGEVDKTDTLWVSGGSGAFRKSMWEKLGGFNPLFNPFYWEDIDLSYRALKAGYSLVFEPNSIVIHEHARGAIKSKYSLFTIQTIAYRNQVIFSWCNMSDASLWISHIAWMPYHILKALLRLDGAFLLGLFYACTKIPTIASQRIKTAHLRIKKDNEIMKKWRE